MDEQPRYAIDVSVTPRFLEEHSDPAQGRYAFAYTITIHNAGREPARLLARHWKITDGEGRVEHVDGEGVIGEQPRLRPGEAYRYTSAVMLGTVDGTMQGHYDMLGDDGTEFIADIAPFSLSIPRTLH